MPNYCYAFLLIAITAFSSTSAQAEIFRWVDANGVTHYGDTEPQTFQSSTMNFGSKLRRPGPPLVKKSARPKQVAPKRTSNKRVVRKRVAHKKRPVKRALKKAVPKRATTNAPCLKDPLK